MKHFLPLFSLLLCLRPSAAQAAAPECEVNVNVAVTPVGNKFPLPTRTKPAYYLPLVNGFKLEGTAIAGDEPPSRLQVLHQLAVTLAEQGYFVVGPKTPPPTVLLVFSWGAANPQIDELGDDEAPVQAFYNQGQMLALVGGHTLGNLELYMEREPVIQGAKEDRYFVVVSAYDFAAAQQKKKVLLWRANMSTPSARVEFFEVVAALIKSGGPHFGRETLRPEWTNAPIERKGRVDLGEIKVKDYGNPGEPPPDKTESPARRP